MIPKNSIVCEAKLGVTVESGFVSINFKFGCMLMEVEDAEKLIQSLSKAITAIKEQEHDRKA